MLARHLAVGTDVGSDVGSDVGNDAGRESAATRGAAPGAADATVPPQTWTQSFDLDGAEVHVTLSKDPT